MPGRIRTAPLAFLAVLAALCGVAWGLTVIERASVTVGIEGSLKVMLAEKNLRARAVDDRSILVLRIATVGDERKYGRYDLRYIALAPGTYDLRDYLVRPDGSPTTAADPLLVEIAPLLAPDHQGALEPERIRPLSGLGGYRALFVASWALWLLLLIPLLLHGRRRKEAPAPPPLPPLPTLAERLRPLVERAAEGRLDAEGQARLERMLLGHWRERIGIEELGMSDAIGRLKRHPEAGRLLEALEAWLHQPPGRANVDVAKLLRPYGEGN